MKASILPIFTLTVLAALTTATPTTSAQPASVACGVFGPGIRCINPISQGVVDGQWIGLIFRYNGTNGGPDAIDVVTIGLGGNGMLTMQLPRIKPAGDYGDRMGAVFRNGKLIVSNAIYLPGEAHCCFTHMAVRRFGFHDRRLVAERLATVPNAASATQIDAVLEQGVHYF
jgi:hypothetical protein